MNKFLVIGISALFASIITSSHISPLYAQEEGDCSLCSDTAYCTSNESFCNACGSLCTPPPAPPAPTQFWMDVCWGGIACMDSLTLTVKFNDAFFLAASAIALTIFLIGAFLMVISAGQDTLLQPAKRAMKGSLIGLALIVGSYGIYRTVVFILYS